MIPTAHGIPTVYVFAASPGDPTPASVGTGDGIAEPLPAGKGIEALLISLPTLRPVSIDPSFTEELALSSRRGHAAPERSVLVAPTQSRTMPISRRPLLLAVRRPGRTDSLYDLQRAMTRIPLCANSLDQVCGGRVRLYCMCWNHAPIRP